MKQRNRYVQYGCGFCAPETWLNFDASPLLLFERWPLVGRMLAMGREPLPPNVRYGDIVKGLPIAAQSCDAVYCSHVLEHLALADFRLALRNTHSILRAGGVFRMVMPDLEFLATQYLADGSPSAASDFMRRASLGQETRGRGIVDLLRLWLGHSRHLWLWDFAAAASELDAVGFVAIRKAMPGDADEPAFRDVEREDRWIDAFAIECRRA
jgi:SAM-dependent methyltransferase